MFNEVWIKDPFFAYFLVNLLLVSTFIIKVICLNFLSPDLLRINASKNL